MLKTLASIYLNSTVVTYILLIQVTSKTLSNYIVFLLLLSEGKMPFQNSTERSSILSIIAELSLSRKLSPRQRYYILFKEAEVRGKEREDRRKEVGRA